MNNILEQLKQWLGIGQTVSPLPSSGPQTITGKDYYPTAIQKGFEHYGSSMGNLAPIFAEATQKYPIFRKYPYLLPAIAILESSGGKNVTSPNNPLNWGIGAQAQGQYNPSSTEQVIRDAMSGIGGRTTEQGFTPAQVSTSSYYEPFRKSGNLEDLANVYAPLEQNPQTGGKYYAKNLQDVMGQFQDYFNKQGR